MELETIKILINKYLEGETSLAEEKILKEYFTKNLVHKDLEEFRPMFGYYVANKNETFEGTLFPKKQINYFNWSVAAAAVVLLGSGIFYFYNAWQTPKMQEGVYYGTCQTPEEALNQTQQALNLVSKHVNQGVKGIEYVNEYNNTTSIIFKK